MQRRWIRWDCNTGIRDRDYGKAVMYEKHDDTLGGNDTNVRDGDRKPEGRVFNWTTRNECQYTVEESVPSK